MSELVYFPRVGWINSEYITSENKDILLIWLYANDPNNLDPRKKFTFQHYAVIKKAELINMDQSKYANQKINFQEFENRAIKIYNQIKYINHYHHEITHCGWKVNNDQWRDTTMLEQVRKHFSDFQLSDLEEGYKLSEFLKVLERGITYEREYLDSLILLFKNTSDSIKKEYGF